jgi:N-acyl homoserine lactone hydrolase
MITRGSQDTIDLHVIECGRTALDHELALTGHPDRIVTADSPTGQRQLLRHPVYVYVINHPEGRVLVDTGVSTSYQVEWREGFYRDAMAYDPGPDGLFTQRLQQLGLEPGDFDHVIISHLHTDHAGNVRLFAPTTAKIYVGENELRGAVTTKGGLIRDDLVTVWGVTSPQGFTRSDWACLLPDRAIEVFADFELLTDVWVTTLPGHTWGTLGLAVKLRDDGWVLVATDAIYLADTWGDKRFVGSLLNQFPDEWAKSAVKIRRMFERYRMTVLPGHDDRVIAYREGGTHEIVPLKPLYR